MKLNKNELLFLDIMKKMGYDYNKDSELKGIKIIDADNTIDVIPIEKLKKNKTLKKQVSFYNTINYYSSLKRKLKTNSKSEKNSGIRRGISSNILKGNAYKGDSVNKHFSVTIDAYKGTVTPERQSIKVSVGNCK